MAIKTNSGAGVRPTIFIVGGIALVLLAGLLGWRFLGSSEPASQVTAQQRSDMEWLKQKAKESGGDLAKLSAEDQKRVYALQGNMGASVLRGMANPNPDD